MDSEEYALMQNIELTPVNRAANGAARRLRAADAIPAELLAAATLDPLALASASGRAVGPPQTVDGVTFIPILFAVEASAEHTILVHLNGYTDSHRTDFRPSLLEPVMGSDAHAGVFLLPSDGIISYRFADVTGLPHDIGSTKEGWREVHTRGVPDLFATEVIPTPLGGDASVWSGPDSVAWSWPRVEKHAWITTRASHRDVHILPGNERVVVLLDGQFWHSLAVGSGLRGAGCEHTIVTIPFRSRDREAELTHPEAIARILKQSLDAVGRELGHPLTEAFAVAGQSFGGLAVGLLAQYSPELLHHGIVQAGSFWYPDYSLDAPGRAVDTLCAGEGDVTTPVIIQVGAEDGPILHHARHYRDALLSRGADVSYREFRGGHDYAWWRFGLVEALRLLDGS